MSVRRAVAVTAQHSSAPDTPSVAVPGGKGLPGLPVLEGAVDCVAARPLHGEGHCITPPPHAASPHWTPAGTFTGTFAEKGSLGAEGNS